MVVVMSPEATSEDIARVVAKVEGAGGEAFVSRGVTRTIIGLVGDIDSFHAPQPARAARRRATSCGSPRPTSWSAASTTRDMTTVWVGRRARGADRAGHVHAHRRAVRRRDRRSRPSRPREMAQAAGATLLRGGAFKPRTSPYAFQGLGEAGLRILADVRAETGLPVVTEVVDAHDVDARRRRTPTCCRSAPATWPNFALLQAVGEAGKPVHAQARHDARPSRSG